MPKKVPSTIQLAGHLAQDYIENKIRDTREEDEIEKLDQENAFETLYRNLNSRKNEIVSEINRSHVPEDDNPGSDNSEEDNPEEEKPEEVKPLSEEEIKKREELAALLDDLQDQADRALSSAKPLAKSANTVTTRYVVKGAEGQVLIDEDRQLNHGENTAAQRDLHDVADNLKNFKRTLDKLEHDFPEELEKPYMKEFLEGIAPEKVANGRGILKNCGDTKTAYEWIEESKAKLHSKDFLDELDAAKHIARIVAARQLCSAKAKETDSLKKHSFSEGELDARAYQLLEEPSFATYLKTIGVSEVSDYGIDDSRNEFAFDNLSSGEKPYLKFFGSGDHGGKLEADMLKYYSKRSDTDQLDKGLFGRYLRAPEAEKYGTFQQYILENKQLDGVMSLDIGAKDPAFRLICRSERAMYQLKIGNPAGFFDTFAAYENSFAPKTEKVSLKVTEGDLTLKEYEVSSNKLTQEAMKKLYRKLLGPSDDWKEQEEYVKSGSKKYQQLVASVKAFVEKKPEDLTAEDRLKVFASTVHYQEGREKKRFWKSGRERFDLSMEIGKTAVSGTKAEQEFDKQVDHVNTLRGEPGFLQEDTRMDKRSVRDYVEEEKSETLRQLSLEDSEEIAQKMRESVTGAAKGYEILS